MTNYEEQFARLIHWIREKGWVVAVFSAAAAAFEFLFFGAGKNLPYAGLLQVTDIVALGITGFILARRDFRKPVPIDPERKLPKSVKGLSPFIEEENEAELFATLGRGSEIDNLVQHTVDDQIPLVVLRGEAGSGKSSLLRAGLIYRIKKLSGSEVCYWPATSDCTIEQFFSAVKTCFKASLAELLSEESDDKTPKPKDMFRVVIIDHFDFLRPGYPQHDPFFELLENLCERTGPYRLKFIIAFRMQYQSVWSTIFQRLRSDANIIVLGLHLLPRNIARQAMATLLKRAGVDIDDKVTIARYISQVARGTEVFPLSIGLGCEVFDRWARMNRRSRVRRSLYLGAGGAKGVLADHVQQQFELLPESDYRPLLNALYLRMVDKATGTRNMAGTLLEDVVEAAGFEASSSVLGYLRSLAAANKRIIERVDATPSEEKYRLANESLVGVLWALSQQSSSASLNWSVTEQFEYWKERRTFPRLLRPEQARGIRKAKLAFGASLPELKSYIMKSQLLNRTQRFVLWSLVVGIMLFGARLSYKLLNDHLQSQSLAHWGLPPDLYTKQDQLHALHIQTSGIEHLDWLQSRNLSELEINGPNGAIGLRSINGITRVPYLQTLTLNLSNSSISDLVPVGSLHELKKLILLLGSSRLTGLQDLKPLRRLETFSLSLGNSNVDFATLSELPNLTTLTLDLQDSLGQNVRPLSSLSNLTELTLNLKNSRITELPDLSALTRLRKLTVNLEQSSIHKLDSIRSLSSLWYLNINLTDSTNINELPDFSLLNQLECLKLDLAHSTIASLPGSLKQLTKLKTLILNIADTPIKELPVISDLPQLESLTLDLKRTTIKGLPVLKKKNEGLESIALNSILLTKSDIQKLNQLSFLHSMSIDVTACSEAQLPDFKLIHGLQKLTLHLNWAQLKKLPHLPAIGDFTLYVQGSIPEELSPDQLAVQLGEFIKLSTVTKLILAIDDSRISALPHFGDANSLVNVELHLQRCEINDMSSISELKHVSILTVDVSGCTFLKKSPPWDSLPHLQVLKLNLQRSQITDLSNLAHANQLQNVTIEVGETMITTFPDLTLLGHVTNVIVSADGNPAMNLNIINKLKVINQLTLNRNVSSLAGLLGTVTDLRFGETNTTLTFDSENREECPQRSKE